ncbi:MAG: hypothetical protein LBT20_04740 [Clostridiales bacterium]|jgi:hypothetical protein|nr:hypothetical protein [Clostridiales bacterium]
MTNKELADNIEYVAKKEIEEFGLPTKRHYDLSLEYGIELAKRLRVDVDVVRAGVALMDIKLGQSAKEGKQPQHVEICKQFTEELLHSFGVQEPLFTQLVNCVEAHHGKVPFASLEAEIVANADCYRFIHPRGVMSFYATVIKRGNEHDAALKAVKAKLDEKKGILSLKEAKDDLEKYYNWFDTIIEEAYD